MKPYLPYLLLLLLASCKPGTDEIPAYIHVPQFEVFTTSPIEGSASHKITDVWLYVNDEIQGVYELPVTVPILASGETKITLSPGILANGISTTRVQYPFYTDTIMYFNLVPGAVDTAYPAVTYRSGTDFLLNEDFENGNEFNNALRITNQLTAFEGIGCGKMAIDSTRKTRIITDTKFSISQLDGVVVFVELNYKSSHVMKAGIVAESASNGSLVISKVNISPQEDWNKIYLNFTPEINGTLAETFQFFLEVDASGSTDPVEIYVDNVKVLVDQ